MKLRDQYDWVVLGDSPAALVSASLAARLGLSVLVLPLGPKSAPTLLPDFTVFDPERNWIGGLSRSPDSRGWLF